MKLSLRTLLLAVAILPPLLAAAVYIARDVYGGLKFIQTVKERAGVGR